MALAGLGAFHGINPAMGWLFAVALGLQRRTLAAVLSAIPPIALGHAVSIGAVVGVVAVLQALIDLTILRWGSAVIIAGFGVYRLVARHKGRVGMQVGFAELSLWSFLMATAHGAGLMLVPVLLHMPPNSVHVTHLQAGQLDAHFDPVIAGVLAVAIHTAAMLATTGIIAVVVYRWVGLAFLRRGWVNTDLLWGAALIVAGVVSILGIDA
jgi:hypothetical protein